MEPHTKKPIPTEAVLLHSMIELTREKGELLPRSTIVRHTVERHIKKYEQVRTRQNDIGADPDTFRKHLYKMMANLIAMRYLRKENGLIGLDFNSLMKKLWTSPPKRKTSHKTVLSKLQRRVNSLTNPEEAVRLAQPIIQARRRKEEQPPLPPRKRDNLFKHHLKELKALYETDPEVTYGEVEHVVTKLKIRTVDPNPVNAGSNQTRRAS